jgi:hypothetical protein
LENLEAEKEHVEGFSPELAIVTYGGGEELVNKLADSAGRAPKLSTKTLLVE